MPDQTLVLERRLLLREPPEPVLPARASTTRGRRLPPGVRRLVPYAVLVLAQLVVALDLGVPVLRPLLALGTFVVLPTVLLARRASLPADSGAARLAYGFGLAVLGLLLGGLALDLALPLAGVDRPLAPLPLAIAWLVADAVLLTWRRDVPLLGRDGVRAVVRAAVDARFESAQAAAVVALLLSVAGAVRLNNGATGAVATAAVMIGVGALLALLVGRGPLGRDVTTLVLVSAGLLLATSLRGWGITGHDIQAEYLVFRLTDGPQLWSPDALANAYNACLSVTVLPTVVAQATGLSGELVFKVLLQLVFATVPALTYLLARRVVTRRLAIAAAVFTMAFPTFSTDMPYLVRQEVAFFFLALLLLAATEPGRTRVASRVLVVGFGVGVALSHYSTTYVLLMALGAGLAGAAALAVVRRLCGRAPDSGPAAGPPTTLLHPLVAAALVAVTLAWAGPVTHTGGHAGDVVRQTIQALRGDGESGPGSSDTSYSLFGGDTTTPRERMDLFVHDTLTYRDQTTAPADRVVARPGPAELEPTLHEQPTAPLADAARIGCAVLMQLFAVVGVVWLLRRRGAGAYGDGPSREVALLSWGAMTALGLIVVVPNLSVDYGVLRAFQQTLLVIAPVMAIGMWVVLRPVARLLPRVAGALAVVVPVGLLLVLSGVIAASLGAPGQRMALANAGTYYDRFLAPDSEVAAMRWLGAVDHDDRSNERIIAARNITVRLLGTSDNRAPVADRLYPTLLTRDAYVFVDHQVLDEGTSTVFYTGDLLTYTYPLQDLDRRLDLVYSGPHSRVYR